MAITHKLFRTRPGRALALALTSLSLIAPAQVFAADPTGTWQTRSGDSRYMVSYCGDGTELCARLVWLRDDARTEENLAYLNTNVVTGADAAAENRWTGVVTYGGETFTGSLSRTGADELKLRGCKGILCTTLRFDRV